MNKNFEKYGPHLVGGIIAIIILIMSNKPGSTAGAAVQGFKAGAVGYLVGWLIAMGTIKLIGVFKK